MKSLRHLIPVALLAGLLLPASYTQSLDANGNVLGPSGAGVDTPGTLISQISHPIPANKHSDIDTVGGQLLAVSAYDSTAVIYLIDWFTGAQMGTVPIDNSGDFGVGYDTSRNLYLTTKTSQNVIKAFDGVSAIPVNVIPVTWGNPVGIAYDSNRDLYWVCTWNNNQLTPVDPNTGLISTFVSTINLASLGCTRPAGVAYDPTYDQVSVGGRDQNMAFIIDPATSLLATSFSVPGGTNNPQGVASFSSGASLWASSWNDNGLYELDNGHALELDLDFSIVPGTVHVNINNIPAPADCRLFFDFLPGPYTGSGPFGGATISFPQLVLTLTWPAGVAPLSTFGAVTTLTYGPYPSLAGVHLNAFVVDFVGSQIQPPVRADGGTFQ